MSPLLDDKFAPLTYRIGFLAAPISDIVATYARWMRLILNRVKRRDAAQPLMAALPALQPLDSSANRLLPLGIELFDDRFYAGSGVIVSAESWLQPLLRFLPTGPRECTLEEARKRLGIE